MVKSVKSDENVLSNEKSLVMAKNIFDNLNAQEKAELLKYIEKNINDIAKSDDSKIEPILDPNVKKYTTFPIQYQSIWNLYKEQMACFWKPEEIDFSNDYNDFLTLNDNEKHFVEMILAFFAASDGIVNFNLGERFIKEIQNTDILTMYRFQAMIEDIHGHTYSLMLDNVVKDNAKKEYLFNAIQNVESVKLMADWAFKWIESSESFAHRVVAFAVIEGIFFSGAFAAIFWLKKYKNKHRESGKGKPFMDGLIKSNKFISRDEGLHTKGACEVYSLLNKKLLSSEINRIIREGVTIAQKFMTDALPVSLIGMNSQSMNDYIEYIADRLLIMLGYKKIYNKQNPFKFMETIGLNDKTNFFETRPHEYQDSHIMNKGNKSKIVINDEF
jgi:ribonucleoside-diphosphate reductase beta chain